MEKVKITKTPLKWPNSVDGNQYRTNTEHKEGDAMLIYAKVGDLIGHELHKEFLECGLSEEDTIVHLNEFYPNGRGLDEATSEGMRTGFGTTVLDFLIEEARQKGAQGMYAFTGKVSMQKFLQEKHDFKKVAEYYYFKKI